MIRRLPLPAEIGNPAPMLINFLDGNIERIPCDELILDMAKSKQYLGTMMQAVPIGREVARLYVAV